jgi:hypothetical protein
MGRRHGRPLLDLVERALQPKRLQIARPELLGERATVNPFRD